MPDKSLLTKRDVKAEARAMLNDGMPVVVGAFNLAANRDWQFPRDVQVRAEELIHQLGALFWENEASITPTKSARAQSDGDFQRFMQTTLSKPKRRGRGGLR